MAETSGCLERLECRCLPSSIAGLWVGSRAEAGLSGTFADVTITLDLTQSGRNVTGTEQRSSSQDAEYFADLLTHGRFVGQTFALQDESITASKSPSNYVWLLYTATLQLSTDGQTLSGRWHGGNVHGTMTLQRVPLPRITLSAAATTDGAGVAVRYTIATAAVTQPLRFDIYRSSAPHLNAGSQLIGSQTLSPARRARALAVGSHRVTLLSGTALGGDTRRPYVIVVANGDGSIVEAAGSINAGVFALS